MSDPLKHTPTIESDRDNMLNKFVRRGRAAQAAADEASKPRDDSFPYWRIWQTYKHLNGVTYEAILEKVAFFERNPQALETWLRTGGNANLSHLVAVAFMKEMARRARVIAETVTPREIAAAEAGMTPEEIEAAKKRWDKAYK